MQQRLAIGLGQLAQRAHRVFALHAVARVHEPVGDVARGREDQQAFGIEVETANRHPLAGLDARQAVEHGRTAFRIALAHDFA
ncbi:hypothetical protein D3C72_1316480 [compost metagenome]